MRTPLLALVLPLAALVLVLPVSAQGQLWRVDNGPTPTVPPDFTDLTAAIAAASSGDTLIVVGTPIPYCCATYWAKVLNSVGEDAGGARPILAPHPVAGTHGVEI